MKYFVVYLQLECLEQAGSLESSPAADDETLL